VTVPSRLVDTDYCGVHLGSLFSFAVDLFGRIIQLQRLIGVVFDSSIQLLSTTVDSLDRSTRSRIFLPETLERAPASTQACRSGPLQEVRGRFVLTLLTVILRAFAFFWISDISHSLLLRFVCIESHQPAVDRSSAGVVPLSKFGLRHTVPVFNRR